MCLCVGVFWHSNVNHGSPFSSQDGSYQIVVQLSEQTNVSILYIKQLHCTQYSCVCFIQCNLFVLNSRVALVWCMFIVIIIVYIICSGNRLILINRLTCYQFNVVLYLLKPFNNFISNLRKLNCIFSRYAYCCYLFKKKN